MSHLTEFVKGGATGAAQLVEIIPVAVMVDLAQRVVRKRLDAVANVPSTPTNVGVAKDSLKEVKSREEALR